MQKSDWAQFFLKSYAMPAEPQISQNWSFWTFERNVDYWCALLHHKHSNIFLPFYLFVNIASPRKILFSNFGPKILSVTQIALCTPKRTYSEQFHSFISFVSCSFSIITRTFWVSSGNWWIQGFLASVPETHTFFVLVSVGDSMLIHNWFIKQIL